MSTMTFTITERDSAQYSASLEDATGTPIPLAIIVSAKLTLKDVDTGTIINSRNGQNVLNTNNVTIHGTTGLITWVLQPADNSIVTMATEHELHCAVFDVVYATDQRVIHEVYFLVENIGGVS